MKRSEIVKRLMIEGFSSETLMKMPDKQLNLLGNRILSEQSEPGMLNVKTGSPDEKKLKQLGKSFVAYENEIKEDSFDKRPAVDSNFIEIETPIGGFDYKLFKKIVDAGIDSHLNAFTKSKFGNRNYDSKQVAFFNFHIDEKPILIQRLEDLYNNEFKDQRIYDVINDWIDSINSYDGNSDDDISEDVDSIIDQGNDSDINQENNEPFEVHGYYTVSNSGGYEIMLSDDGEMARVRDAFGSDDPETSDWLPIEYVTSEDDEDEPVIDPEGYNIPLSQVMRANKYSEEEQISNDDISEDYDDASDQEKTDKNNLIGFTIPNWAISYLINGDLDGLEDDDTKKVQDFEHEISNKFGNANFLLGGGDEPEDMGFCYRNDIDNLGGDCTKLYIMKNIQEKQEVKTWLENIVESNYSTFTTKKEITEIINEKLKKHKKKAKLLLGQDVDIKKPKTECKKTK
jgi:hypothetical protein